MLEEQGVVEKEHIMSTITVQLPETLAESLRREVLPPDKAIIKALEEWLETRQQEQRERSFNMFKEIIFLVEEAPEGGYIARALGHSIFTEADTWDELKEAAQDAVRCHFEVDERPALLCLHIVQEEILPV